LKKLCFILPIYVLDTDRHFNHIYDFLDILAGRLSLSLIFESGEKADRFGKADRVDVVTGRFFLLKKLQLAWFLLRNRLGGCRIFYSHYCFSSLFFAWLITRLSGGRTYLWHSIMMKNLMRDIDAGPLSRANIFFRLSLFFADRLVTGTRFMADYYIHQCGLRPEKAVVIPNYINLKRFADVTGTKPEIRRRLGLPEDRDIVLYVHGLERGKGGLLLPDIFSRVLDAHPAAYFVVVGDGSRKPEIEKMLAEKSLTAHVLMAGRVPNRSIAEYYAAADIFISPSIFDAFSRTILEAMAMGLPFVASESEGTLAAFTAPEQHAYLTPLDGIDAFTGKLIGLLKDPQEQERMSRIGKEWVKRFSVDRVGEQFLEKIN
jgi:glycosyltransferase involved in cell wall biosynthesis